MLINTKCIYLIVFTFIFINLIHCDDNKTKKFNSINLKNTKIWGPGITPDAITLPVRYFFIQAIDINGKEISHSLPVKFTIEILGESKQGACRYTLDQLDRGDGSYIVRYKLPYTCRNVQIHITHKGQHVAQSPYTIRNPVQSDNCDCPNSSIDNWRMIHNCPAKLFQIENDLRPFRNVNFTILRSKILEKYNNPGSISLCNYLVKDNQVYRECHGKYTGFKMFMDALLLSLVRKVQLPDTEFFVNLGDWPLVKKGGHARTTGPYPIFSWCGSEDTFDIVMPTYDITESTLEAMHRVSLDMLSVQERHVPWTQKIPKAFWRGRDSRRERLQLIDISRLHPDLFNVSMTNFFFFRDEADKYGPKVPHMSFFQFFDYKYQINIDGTVAAYRFPYLLAGNSVVFKQDSPFYEHFYRSLAPNEHYIPFKRDLSDLVEKIQWAKENDNKVQKIARNAQIFARENLLPIDILCYHVILLQEWSKNIISEVKILPGMEHVPFANTNDDCDCTKDNQFSIKDEL